MKICECPIAERPYETLKRPAIIFLVFGFVLTGFIVWGGITGRRVFLPGIVCGICCAAINTSVWFTFSGAIKSGDISMISGFDSKIRYHIPTLRRFLDALRFWMILSAVLACLPLSLTVFLPIKMGFGFFAAVFISYIVCAISGLEFIERRYSDTLFLDSCKVWVTRASRIPTYLLLGSLFLTLIFAAVGIECFGLKSNTIPAMLFTMILMLVIAIESVVFLIDFERNKRLAEKSEGYRPKMGVAVGYTVCIILDTMLLAVCVTRNG